MVFKVFFQGFPHKNIGFIFGLVPTTFWTAYCFSLQFFFRIRFKSYLCSSKYHQQLLTLTILEVEGCIALKNIFDIYIHVLASLGSKPVKIKYYSIFQIIFVVAQKAT